MGSFVPSFGLFLSIFCFILFQYASFCFILVYEKQKGVDSRDNRGAGDCELPCRCCESNLGLLEEPVPLNTEPSLQSQEVMFQSRF